MKDDIDVNFNVLFLFRLDIWELVHGSIMSKRMLVVIAS